MLPSGRDEGEGEDEVTLPFAGDGGADCTHGKPMFAKAIQKQVNQPLKESMTSHGKAWQG